MRFHKMISTIYRKKIKSFLIFCFWVSLWALVAKLVGHQLLIASPKEVVIALFELLKEAEFYSSVLKTCLKIAIGFISSLCCGVLFAYICSRVTFIRELFTPLIRLIRSIPVASIVIVILIWISSKNLSIVTSFMMSFPIIYENVLKGIMNVDTKLIEMAKVFHLTKTNKLKAIYLPQVLPYLESATVLSLGLCWKAGVAAEIIGLPTGTIGEKLYQAKVFFDTPSVFAWTAVIILLSFVFEKVFALLIKKGIQRWKV